MDEMMRVGHTKRYMVAWPKNWMITQNDLVSIKYKFICMYNIKTMYTNIILHMYRHPKANGAKKVVLSRGKGK